MSQLGEQTQEDSAEDLDEDSAEDTKEESNEDLNEDSKEEKEDTDEELNEDLEEEKEDSDEELNEDSEEELDEDLEEEKEDSDEDLNEDSEEELDEDLEEERESGFIDTPTGALYDTPEGIFSLPEPTGIEDSDLTNLEEEREFEIPEGFREIPEGIEHLDVPESSELSLPEPTGIEPSDLTNLDADASDVPSDVIDIPEGTELSLPEPTGIEPSDLFNLDANASDVPSDVIDIPEGTELSLPELIGIEASDLSNLDANASEGVTEHSEINSYTENNEGTTTCLLINEQEESNELACESQEDTAIKDTLENELSNELQADTSLQDSLENEVTAQDTLENELPSELQDGSTLQDELSELDENLSELEDTSSSELREYPFIQDVLENELSELDGELSELKDISSSGLQEAPVMQDVLEDEIGDELTHSEKESWDLKDMFLNEFIDLSDTQYSLEEASLEISNAMEPMALDIANVHTKTFRQDYVGDPQIENVFEEENENEINYDLSIDKNNQEASEQELSLIGKESGEESKEITAATSSTTSTEQKESQEDHKESEPTSERNEESHNNNDIKDSEKDSENLNKETDEDVKLEGEESEDLEDLIDKAIEEFKILKDPKLKEMIKTYDGIAYKGNHFTTRFIKFIKDQDNDALTKKENGNLIKGIEDFNENKDLDNLLKYYIGYTNLSQSKILRKLKYMNLKTSRNTLTKISHKILTREKYKKRFPYLPNLSDKQREGIINADSEEQDESEIEVLINKDEYRNLMDSELKLYFKEYFEKTRKYANYGLIIRNGFKSFLESQKKIPNNVKEQLINKISKINENKEIEVFLYNLFKSTNLSPREISKTFSRISLYLSTTTIRKKAKKALTPEEKKKRFPPPPKVSKDVREKIIADIKDPNSGNLSDMSRKYGYSTTTIVSIAEEVLTPEEKKKRFPPPPKISKDVREKIIADIKNPNSGSQHGLAKKYNVSKNQIGRIARKVLTSEEKKKRFPPPTKLSKDVREKLIADIKNPNSGNQDDIAKKYNMSGSQIGNIAKKALTPEERRKRFPYQTKKDLNMDAEEEIKFEDLEDLIEKAKEDFKIFKDPKLKEIIRNYDGIAYKGNHFFIRFIKFIKDQDNDALTKEEKDKLVKRIYKFNENKNINNLLIYYIKYTDLSQNKILKKLEDMNLKAPQHTLKNISREILTQKKYEDRFTANKDIISDEQREGIIKAGRSENPDTIGNISIKWGVSPKSALNIIRNDLGEREFNKKFHSDIPQLIGLENHKLIEKIATQDFDEKRKKTPDVPILISEPPIYTNSDKHCDNAFKNDKKYLQKLLKDKIAKELNIDPKKLDHIKVVLFDYTSWLHKYNIMDKILKYQHSKIMLFIVGTHWLQNWIGRVKKLPKNKRIKSPENIRIIRWDLFADLLNLSDDNRKQLEEIIKLTRLKDLETLIKLNEQNNYKLHPLKKSKTRKKGYKNDLDAFLKKI